MSFLEFGIVSFVFHYIPTKKDNSYGFQYHCVQTDPAKNVWTRVLYISL